MIDVTFIHAGMGFLLTKGWVKEKDITSMYLGILRMINKKNL